MGFSDAHPIKGKIIPIEQREQDGFIKDNLQMVAKVISESNSASKQGQQGPHKLLGPDQRIPALERRPMEHKRDPLTPRYKPVLGVARAKSLNPYEVEDLQ
ncbi:hypothetical protein PIB30_013220 [Stylosanthes scabra]|uniref:Uncharacterized protein n=1 Tax=Stylosanthes scabra TaxID=79078 RepID=A0ABU6Q6B5_9FABA|nr:hypothetical protein [Stylosanthes scabra]